MTGSLPARTFCAAVNHLLAQQPGLAAGLKPHAGKLLSLELAAVVIPLHVTGEGLLAPATAEGTTASARIQLPPALILRLPLEGRGALRAAATSGDASFLDALNQAFGLLEWDAEADLSTLLGPVAGTRLARATQQLPAVARHGFQTLLASLADYATEEAGWLANQREVRRFNRDVDELADDAARLEARLEARLKRLEGL